MKNRWASFTLDGYLR